MPKVRLYDTPQEFAAMMMRQLGESLGATIRQHDDEALLLHVRLPDSDNEHGALQISLHNAFHNYMAGGDLNAAIDYLNDIVRVSRKVGADTQLAKLDGASIFPVIRDERYAEEAVQGSAELWDPCLPGLRVIFVDINNDLVRIVSGSVLQCNPRLTAERVRRLAYRNLISAGWYEAKGSIRSPFRPSCTIDVYADNPHPIEYQFLLPQMAVARMPASYVIAFTNRKHLLVMRSDEPMETPEQALNLVRASKFSEIAKRAYHLMPYSVSDGLYWMHNGQASLLNKT